MFYRLILAHLIGDFVLQNRWLVVRKRTPSGLAIHIGLVGLATLPAIWGQFGKWWPWLAVILIIHALTDWSKIHLAPHLRMPPILPFLADQFVHVATIAIVVLLAEPASLSLVWQGQTSVWWIASVYLFATCAISIALPLWLDPPSLMRRPFIARLTTGLTSALVLTLAWRGLWVLIPLVGLALYQMVARRLAQKPDTPTFAIEFWSALTVAASLGGGLS